MALRKRKWIKSENGHQKYIQLSNPSIPNFLMEDGTKVRDQIIKKYAFDRDNQEHNIISIISQASKAEKRFGTKRFLEMFSSLSELFPNLILVLVNPDEESPTEWWRCLELAKQNPDIKVIDTRDVDFEQLAYIFARSKVNIGNDTGFTHLAAMCKRSLSTAGVNTFSIYSRHDYGKWSTGKDNVYPITTKLADFLRLNNMSVRRDKIDINERRKEEWAISISPKSIVGNIKRHISE